MSNVPSESTYLWFHFTFAYIFSIMACYLLWSVTDEWLTLRTKWVRSQQLHSVGAVIPCPIAVPENELMTGSSVTTATIGGEMTVMVKGIPMEYRSDAKLFEYFSRLYGKSVISASVCRNTRTLDKLIAKRSQLVTSLQDAFDSLVATGERPLHRPQCGWLCCRTPVDSILSYSEQLDQVNAKIEAELRVDHKHVGRGFVTFISSRSLSSAARTDHSSVPCVMWTSIAPNPGELYWPALSMSPKLEGIRYIAITVIVILMILFWLIPIAFISSLVSLESLEERFSFISDALAGQDTARSFISGFLASIVYILFQMFLPTILDQLARLQGVPAESIIQRWVLRRFYLFIVINFFFGVILASSFLSVINDLSPSELPQLLGRAVPGVSSFFISYILLRALSGFPLLLLRPGPLIISQLFKCRAKSQRQARLAYERARTAFNFGSAIPETLLVCLIGCTYSILSPLILPFLLLYFGFGYFANRYMFLYVIVNTNTETGGSFWPLIFSRWCASLIFSHITLIGVFGVKLAPIQCALLVPLPILTGLFYHYISVRYMRLGKIISTDQAQDVDDILNEAREKARRPSANDLKLTSAEEVKVNIDESTSAVVPQHEPTAKVFVGGQDDLEAEPDILQIPFSKREQILCEAFVNPSLKATNRILVVPPNAADQSGHSLQNKAELLRMNSVQPTKTTLPPGSDPGPSRAFYATASDAAPAVNSKAADAVGSTADKTSTDTTIPPPR